MQIENEYGPESNALGAAGHAYVNWAAKMAVGMGTGVPWVMCKEDDAPDPMVGRFVLSYLHFFVPILSCKQNYLLLKLGSFTSAG